MSHCSALLPLFVSPLPQSTTSIIQQDEAIRVLAAAAAPQNGYCGNWNGAETFIQGATDRQTDRRRDRRIEIGSTDDPLDAAPSTVMHMNEWDEKERSFEFNSEDLLRVHSVYSRSLAGEHRKARQAWSVDGVDIQRHIRNLWAGYSICTGKFMATPRYPPYSCWLLRRVSKQSHEGRLGREEELLVVEMCIANNNIIYLSVANTHWTHR